MKHTPRPWQFTGNTIYALEHHGWRKGEEVMQNRFYAAAYGATGTPPEEVSANIALMAAAPTMYDFIKLCAESGDKQAVQILESIHANS